MIGLLEVSRQFNNREIFIERARDKILAFFIALKLNYVKITKVLSASVVRLTTDELSDK
jgi:hypothetical protein